MVALGEKGWTTEYSEVHWVDAPRARLSALWSGPRAVVLAHRADEPSDVLLVRTRTTPEGRLLSISDISNLSDTSSVDEAQVTVSGDQAAWTVNVSGETTAIHRVRLAAADPLPSSEFGAIERLQMHVTWWQETGQWAGIQKEEYRVEPPSKNVTLAFHGEDLVGVAEGESFSIVHGQATGSRLRPLAVRYGHPGNLITWGVDRLRAWPVIGSERMQLLKTLGFDMLDRFERIRGQITADNGRASLDEEVGHALQGATLSATDPESGWPPAAMKPCLKDPLPHEGQWSEMEDDPFIVRQKAQPAPFLFSFVRTDPERTYTKVFVVLWDPRHLDLHMMSGTREPKTATGETGPGQVPRDDETLSSFVAAFNGGFQATHGEFGMMADQVVYLPPKPYAATVARLADGSTAFGTWPDDETIPEEVVSFRQNLTPLVMDGKINPYQRTWWGGVPPGWEDATRTVRTGLCLTQEGFVGYFYASSIDAMHLADAMQAARCQYGLQLDMNPGHTGFEFYRVGKPGTLPQLNRKQDSQWEARGTVPGNSNWEYMGRRMIRYMNLMHFPRYVRTESRDFFYLTERKMLPPPPVSPRNGAGDVGTWITRSVDQKGWPPAVATLQMQPDPAREKTRVSAIAIDGKLLRLARPADDKSTIISIEPNDAPAHSCALWIDKSDHLSISESGPSAGAKRIASGYKDYRQSPRVAAAWAELPGSLWVYVEVAAGPDPSRDGALLDGFLRSLQAQQMLFFGHPLNVQLGHVSSSANAVNLARNDGPRGLRIFQDTAVVSPKEWHPLQEKRVRYFKTPKQPAVDSPAPNTNTTDNDPQKE